MNYNIIGAGRLGKNLALALSSAKLAHLNSICNNSTHSAKQACEAIGFGSVVNTLKELPEVDITWITSNDDAIKPIVDTLARYSILKAGSLVIHCSGALNSSVLAPLKAQGCFIASLHPLKAFNAKYPEVNAFNQTYCVLEGDLDNCQWLKDSFESLGANLITINPELKIKYHAAATIASNYLITLAASSETLLLEAGISQQQARSMIGNLMQGTINNIQSISNINQALTGPLMRGDINTLSMHLEAITNPAIANLYKAAGLATLPLTSLEEEKKGGIMNLLEK